jgi:predicted CoA-binding protein
MGSVEEDAMPIEDDGRLRELMGSARTVAVLGIKAGAADDAFRVPRYLQEAGYRILPINPKLDSVLGERCVPQLSDVSAGIDILDVFRAAKHVPGHVDEILALDPLPRCVWLQLGIRDDACARRLEAAGIAVVQDRCLLVEHRRLLAGG